MQRGGAGGASAFYPAAQRENDMNELTSSKLQLRRERGTGKMGGATRGFFLSD